MSVRLCLLLGRRFVRIVIIFVVLIVRGIRKFPLSTLSFCFESFTDSFNRAKKKKYPDGYPGDAPSSNTSLPVKYSCHQCSKVFPPIPHPDSGTPQPKQDCVRCGHERCADCPRAPFVRVEPEPDEELVRRVEEKLRGLNVGVSVGGASAS